MLNKALHTTLPSFMESALTVRLAVQDDLFEIITLLSDDPLGRLREKVSDSISDTYRAAFDRIEQNANQELTVAELNGELVGTFHLTFIHYLTHQGGLRAQVEAVRVKSTHRGKGIGTYLFRYIIDRAKEKGCCMVQLTTDKKRPGAVHFYETLGFAPTHEGMKLKKLFELIALAREGIFWPLAVLLFSAVAMATVFKKRLANSQNPLLPASNR